MLWAITQARTFPQKETAQRFPYANYGLKLNRE
jgi:hypothetical protein